MGGKSDWKGAKCDDLVLNLSKRFKKKHRIPEVNDDGGFYIPASDAIGMFVGITICHALQTHMLAFEDEFDLSESVSVLVLYS